MALQTADELNELDEPILKRLMLMRLAEWADETELDAAINAVVSGYDDAMRRHILIETMFEAWKRRNARENKPPGYHVGGLIYEILQVVGVPNFWMEEIKESKAKPRRLRKRQKQPAQILSLVQHADDPDPASKPNEE